MGKFLQNYFHVSWIFFNFECFAFVCPDDSPKPPKSIHPVDTDQIIIKLSKRQYSVKKINVPEITVHPKCCNYCFRFSSFSKLFEFNRRKFGRKDDKEGSYYDAFLKS